MDLIQWNKEVESTGKLENYDDVLHEFLWKTDPQEAYHVDVGFNRNQLLGLLVCRAAPKAVEHIEVHTRLQVLDTEIAKMNLKQLKDTLSNLAFEWPPFINVIHNDTAKVEAVRLYLYSCMHRLGHLIGCAHEENVLNDIHDTKAAEEGSLKRITDEAIRRLLSSLLILLRHFELYDLSEELPVSDYAVGVSQYHHEASNETFHKMCMHYSLPAAAKLQYKNTFIGMYNDVSQAVYFHNTQYKRMKREPYTSGHPLHMLPAVCLLYPEVTVKYEDDFFDPYESNGWYWLLIPQRIYLVSPEPKVYFCSDLRALVKLYVEMNDFLED